MSINKSNLPSESTPKPIGALLGFSTNTVTAAVAYKHGVVTVIEFLLSDASLHFIKFASNGSLEIGGSTPEMGSGTKVTW